jgi:hypothetical protein
MIADPRNESSVGVVCGAWSVCFRQLVGKTVAIARISLADPLKLPPDALAVVGGDRVSDNFRLRANDRLEFVKPHGKKGALEPDEKAQIDRIESLLRLLVEKRTELTTPAVTLQRRTGRRNETNEIAIFANDLKQSCKTWKEIFVASKSKWPGDHRVRNVGQIRATWRRHFGHK